MSVERRVLQFPGIAAAGSIGEKGRSTGMTEPSYFHSNPCLIHTEFLSGIQPGSSEGGSISRVVLQGTGAFSSAFQTCRLNT